MMSGEYRDGCACNGVVSGVCLDRCEDDVGHVHKKQQHTPKYGVLFLSLAHKCVFRYIHINIYIYIIYQHEHKVDAMYM